MAKTKIYKINNNNKSNDNYIISLLVEMFVYAIVLFIASNLFKNFEITNFLYCFIAAIILSALNATIKPFLVFITLPLSIITFGIAYPIVNMIILKVCDLLMGASFVIHGFFSLFFISIFISLLKILLDKILLGKDSGY